MSDNGRHGQTDKGGLTGNPLLRRLMKLGRVGIFIMKNANPRTVTRAVTYVRRHGYRALRGKLLYKFSRKEQVAESAILKSEIAWHMAQGFRWLDTPLTGSFRFPLAGMRCMEFQTVTDGTIPGSVRLRLFNGRDELVREVTLPGTHILDGDYTTFAFEPVPDSAGKRYHFVLEGLGKPWPSLFSHEAESTPDIVFDMMGSVNCRMFADKWDGDEYALWRGKNEPTDEELTAQAAHAFDVTPTISLLVPLFRTDPAMFRAMVDSVRAQTYANWELCLADGGSGSPELEAAAEAYAREDARIRFTALGENRGIAGNTNAAADLATGDFIGLLDHDDTLAPFALHAMVEAINRQPDADFLYSDEDKTDEVGAKRFDPHFKPDFAPDTLRSYNYICHFTVIRRSLFEAVGRYRPGFDGSQDYDLFLRATEQARRIVHVPKILYHWRVSALSTARDGGAKPYVIEASCKALQSHLERVGLPGTVTPGLLPTVFNARLDIAGTPMVSVLIPNKDHVPDLKKCLDSLLRKTEWPNYEVLVIENNSKEAKTFRYYEEIARDPRVRVITWKEGFNYAAINNFAAREAKGAYLLLLNNDTEIIDGDWMTRMLEHAQRPEVGAVGAMLLYPDDTIQHAGVIIGMNSLADHAFKTVHRDVIGYFARTHIVQDVGAVTGACLMVRKAAYDAVGGLDERFAVAFNDIDFCMKLRRDGFLIVWTPYARLYHHESKSRGYEDTPKKQKRFLGEIEQFYDRWGQPPHLVDPYYNPNLSLTGSGFDLRI